MMLYYGCTHNNDPIKKDNANNEIFADFYEMFFTDSTFQLSRIEFPIMRNHQIVNNESHYWDIDNWQYLKKVNLLDERIERFLYDLDGVIEENIIISKRFRIKNTYSLIDNQWFLTSYTGMMDLDSRE